MKFYNTIKKDLQVSFKEAVTLLSNKKNGGLFMPLSLGKISQATIYRNPPPSFRDLSFEIAKQFCSDEIPSNELMSIIAQFFPYRIPISPVAPTTYVLELFHGPTCNYKDIPSGFLAYLLESFNKEEKKPFNLITACSGERACSIGTAVSKAGGLNAILLYPKNSLTKIQAYQLSQTEENVHCLCVDGSFEDCKNLVNKIFEDEVITKDFKLIAGNGLNIASLIPQIAFFVYASLVVFYRSAYDNKIERPEIVFSIPSGSFANLTAGLMAKKMGAPIAGFICAENENHVAGSWLKTGKFEQASKIKTNTPALDIASPVNFERMLELYSFEELQGLVKPYSLDSKQTIEAVRACNERTGYIIDPYGGMAWKALHDIYSEQLISSSSNLVGIILQTSHPAKFNDIMKTAIGRPPSLPDRLEIPNDNFNFHKEVSLNNSYLDFKNWIKAQF